MSYLEEIFSLKGKRVLLTGGHGLYGSQITLALCKAGASVIIASRSVEKNKALVEELTAKGYDITCEAYDQGDEASIIALGEKIKATGGLDVLINNSVLRIMKGYHDSAENFSKSLEVNGTGLFLMHRVFGDMMAEKGNGSIINIGSYMGILGADDTLYRNVSFSGFNSPDYFFHKGGMTNLTRFMASKYGPQGVRVNVLELGGLLRDQDQIFVERYNDRTFLKRMANDTDLMGIIILLASDASSYITGAVIPVDGGYSAK